jgi:ketosteroid isomerase-like protein
MGTVASMDIVDAARTWAQTWERAWPAKDVEAIAALYADEAQYRAYVFREPDRRVEGVRDYLRRNFAVEHDIECRFGEPFAAGNRAATEWWANWVEDGEPLTMAGVTILRFDDDGRIVDHRDYWNEVPRREPPYSGW